MTFIKVCGITRLEDAQEAIRLDVQALGFNFYRNSPRYIEPQQAKAIVSQLRTKQAWMVGVFVDEARDRVQTIAETVGLDALQFHGKEDLAALGGWGPRKVVKAVRLSSATPIDEIKQAAELYDLVVLDAFDPLLFGGTGKEIPAQDLARLGADLFSKVLLSGGLTPENVAEKVRSYRPFGVDVASGIESSPGRKDWDAMRKFVDSVRRK